MWDMRKFPQKVGIKGDPIWRAEMHHQPITSISYYYFSPDLNDDRIKEYVVSCSKDSSVGVVNA